MGQWRFPTYAAILPSPTRTCVCAAHLASASLPHLPFPLRVRRVHPHSRPPIAPTPVSPHSYLHTRSLPLPVSVAWAPVICDGSRARV
jgi:hypothetical protein